MIPREHTMTTIRKRDELWDALETIFPAPVNDLERGRWNKALKYLRQSGATPASLVSRAAFYRAKWPRVTCSPMALAAHWSELAPRRVDRPAAPQTPTAEDAAWMIRRHLEDLSSPGLTGHRRDEKKAGLDGYIEWLPESVKSDPSVAGLIEKARKA